MVTLTRLTILRYLVAAALISLPFVRPAAAQNSNIFERVLVPISVGQAPGAFGTLWSTELWYRNNSNRPVVVFPLAFSDAAPTPPGITQELRIFVLPASTPGGFLYVSRDGIDDVQFDLRLFNRSDPSAKWGTKLPVVREREFAGSISLINVPTGADFRSALRIYGEPYDALAGETVLIQIYSNYERLLVSTEMPFNGTTRYAALLSLADAYPQIRQVDRIRVHVESHNGRKIWAFVSVTSNTTQDVSIVTPN